MRGTGQLTLVALAALVSACGAETVRSSDGDGGVDVGVVEDVRVDVVADARVDATPDASTAPYVVSLDVREMAYQFALMSDGTVRVRGVAVLGGLGTGQDFAMNAVTIPGLTDIAELVTADGEATCARSRAGAVWCWGSNDNATLGVGNDGGEMCDLGGRALPCRLRPTRVPGVDDAVALGASGRSVCVARRDGSVWCWGSGAGALLMERAEFPTRFAGVSDVVRLWAFEWGWMFLHRDGRYTGVGTLATTMIPAGAALDARPDGMFACYRLPDGTARCLGKNPDGQLGNGSSQWPARVEVAVDPGLTRVRSISAGSYSTCASLEDGTVWCWGSGTSGGLGFAATETCVGIRGPEACATRPGLVPGISGVDRVFVGVWGACALRFDHEVWCWGTFGEFRDAMTPARVLW